MIKKTLKPTKVTKVLDFFLKKFSNKLKALLLLLLLSSSCTDQGCIEADDFGEYEYQTLEVLANNSAESCNYDSSLDINDPSQGTGLTDYLTSGNTTVYDTDGKPHSNGGSGGCSGFDDVNYRTICISNAVQQCLIKNNANVGSAEPYWLPTNSRSASQNYGVTISKNSQLIIKAIGDISLGSSVSYQDYFIQATNQFPSSQGSNWSSKFFDVKSGQTLNVKFSGQWSDGTNIVGGGNNTISGNITTDSKIYNGARRTIAFAIPAPIGYGFSQNATSEKSGTVGVPIAADPEAWQCSYSSSGSSTQSSCNNKLYTSIGYTNADNTTASSTFPITSDSQSNYLGTFGGLIRWNDDGLKNDSYDPFNGVSCSNGSCSGNSPNDIGQGGTIIGNASSAITISNSYSNSYKVTFKSLSTSSACNINLSISVTDSSNKIIDSHYPSTTSYPISIAVNNTSWTTQEIAIEPGQKLKIESFSTTDGSQNCGASIAAKFNKYHDITINQSGFVKFTMLNGNGVAANNCRLYGQIINPQGSHFNIDSTQGFSSDFYEYSNNTTNPLNGLTVLSQSSTYSESAWSNQFFVRKGQKIRFSPSSWNGTWTTESGYSRQCGIGMAMYITPRPALLCRGVSTEIIDNPSCNQDYTTGSLTGCLAAASECSNQSSSSYCPNSCQKQINCTIPSASDLLANNYTKQNCSAGSLTDSSTCYYSTSTSPTITTTKCDNCANLMLTNSRTSAKINQTIDQCYDLENYTGKVENISSSTGFTSSQLSNSTYSKGAVKLGNFNGSYGNLDNFTDTKTLDTSNNNKIYQTRLPLTFSTKSRLKFFVMDGNDFLNIGSSYGNNSAAGINYSGTNGIKVNLSGLLEFNNGEMLAVKLCNEENGSCISSPVSLNPVIVEYNDINTDQSVSTTPSAKSNYQFDSFGNLVRKTSATITADDCSTDIITKSSSSFYCHNKEGSKLRLTFKIIDPEATNCIIPRSTNQSTVNDGILISNPAYDPTVSTNKGTICGLNEVPNTSLTQDQIDAGQTKCKKESYCASKYSNNSGKYYVQIKLLKPSDSNISSIISNVITPVIEIMDGPADKSKPGQAERIYRLIIADSQFQMLLSLSLVISLTFYAVATLIGVKSITHTELVNFVLKMGLIYLFVSPDFGWYWFNQLVVNFFKNGTDYLAFMMASSFDNSPEISQALANNSYYDKSILFSSVDKVFGMFFSPVIQKKISALLFASIFGWLYLWIIYLSFTLYVYAVALSVLWYLSAQVIISILFILGPLFFVLLLFNQTKEMFDNWLKQLITLSLQQIFLLTTLAFFNMMMYEVIKMSLGYKICWDEVWTIRIITPITLMSFWTIPSVNTNANSQIGNIGNPDGIPSLFSILFIWVIASLMNKFITFMTDLAGGLAGGLKATAVGSGLKSAMDSTMKYSKDRMSDVYKGSIGKQIQRLDKALFDSGELASEERKKRNLQNAADMKNKAALISSGNKGVEEFKKNNAAMLAGKTQEEQRKILTDARDSAMFKKGKELGLTPDEVKKLQQQKGSTYTGSSLGGRAIHDTKQLFSGGGTLIKSINDKGVDTKFSNKTAKSALKSKRTSSEDREAISKSMDDGNIKIGRSNLGKMKGALGAIANPIRTLKQGRSAISESAKNIAQKATNSAGLGDYKEAEKTLEASGEIKKMMAGTKMLGRTKEEKDKIKDLMNKNIAQRKADKPVTNNHYALAGLKQYAKVQSELEQDGETMNVRSKDSTIGKLIGREKFIQSGIKDPINNMKEHAALVEQAKKNNIETALSQATKNYTNNKKDLNSATENVKNIEQKIHEANESYSKQNINIDKLEQERKDPKTSEERKAEIAKDIKSIKNHPSYSGFTKNMADLKKQQSQALQTKSNLEKKDSKLSKYQSQANEASENYNAHREFIKESGIEDLRQQKQDFMASRNAGPIRAAISKASGGVLFSKSGQAAKDWQSSQSGKDLKFIETTDQLKKSQQAVRTIENSSTNSKSFSNKVQNFNKKHAADKEKFSNSLELIKNNTNPEAREEERALGYSYNPESEDETRDPNKTN